MYVFFVQVLTIYYASQLTQGPNEHAEIFGTELASERVYAFPPGSKVAVWTWHGCHLQVFLYQSSVKADLTHIDVDI